MQKLIKVKLLGELGRKFGRSWEFAITNPAQAIRALSANIGTEFIQYLHESELSGIGYRVVIDDPAGISLDGLNLEGVDHIVIAPQLTGRGGGFGRILLGGAILAASFFMPATIGILGATISSTAVGFLGASLILGGVTQMLSPTPKTPKGNDNDKKNSFLFDQASDTSSQGKPVPSGFGKKIISDFIIISSAEDVEQLAV